MPERKDFSSVEPQLSVSGWTEWLNGRTSIRSLFHEALDEPTPGHARWAYVFESGLLYLLLVQVVTWIFLALCYVPSSDHTLTTVSYFWKVVASGLFLSSVHAYGATAIIILLFLHISQMLHRTRKMIEGGMPQVHLNPTDTAAFVAYLRSLKPLDQSGGSK